MSASDIPHNMAINVLDYVFHQEIESRGDLKVATHLLEGVTSNLHILREGIIEFEKNYRDFLHELPAEDARAIYNLAHKLNYSHREEEVSSTPKKQRESPDW